MHVSRGAASNANIDGGAIVRFQGQIGFATVSRLTATACERTIYQQPGAFRAEVGGEAGVLEPLPYLLDKQALRLSGLDAGRHALPPESAEGSSVILC